ncbi:MAG: 13E12 repeat family protein, partial [Actinomycetota bacterium]|nr:13E12 repeat family protein [Actinomycetota bacterium]
MAISVAAGSCWIPDGPPDINPSFVAEWEAMSEAEYAASIRDVPDAVLDAAPTDELPEDVWLVLAEAEAARLPDALADPPGPGMAGSLAAVPDGELGDGGLIDRVTGFERQASWVAAGQVRAVAELARRRVAARGEEELAFFVDEIALALTCSRYAAWAKLHTALDLVDRLPATLAALAAGRICPARARIIAEGTRALTDADAGRVQDEVLPLAEELTPAKLRALVAAAVAAVGPREDDEQH